MKCPCCDEQITFETAVRILAVWSGRVATTPQDSPAYPHAVAARDAILAIANELAPDGMGILIAKVMEAATADPYRPAHES